MAALAALTAWVYWRFAPWGFNPTDDGYIVSQAARVFRGDVPHADLISPRPLGSAYLHVVDLLIPLPLYEATRLVFVLEAVVMTALFSSFVFRRPPWQWSALEAAACAAAALVDIHVFPLMPWHTMDGLAMLAAGLVALDWALRVDRRWPIAVAFALLGAAPLMKQSFFLAPVLGAVWLVAGRRRDRARLVRDVGLATAAGAAPVILYLLLVAAAGGIGVMVTQITQAARTVGWPPRDGFEPDWARRQLLVLFGRLALAVIAVRAIEMAGTRWKLRWAWVVSLMPRVLAVVVVVRVVMSERLTYGSLWGSKLMWALALVVALRSVVWWRFDGRAAVVAAAALMSTVSWGYAVPNLVAGVVALTLGELFLRDAVPSRLDAPVVRLVASAAVGAIVLAIAVPLFVRARHDQTYFDLGEPLLTARLRDADADLGRVRTNPITAQYVHELATCVADHPARRVALLPDNPGLYPAFGLRSPLSIDWMYPGEIVGSEDRIVDDVSRLDDEGDYLVLFQTVDAFALRTITDLPPATPDSAPFSYGSNLAARILDQLDGGRIACGSFVGVYSPGDAGADPDGGDSSTGRRPRPTRVATSANASSSVSPSLSP